VLESSSVILYYARWQHRTTKKHQYKMRNIHKHRRIIKNYKIRIRICMR